MKLTRIKAPKFKIRGHERFTLNEYEARQLCLEVATKVKPLGIVLMDEEGNRAEILRNGKLTNNLVGWDVGGKISVKMYKNHLKMRRAQQLWEELGDTPVDEDGNIEEEFMDFPVGTDRETIWDWFEETYDISVAQDLMYSDFRW